MLLAQLHMKTSPKFALLHPSFILAPIASSLRGTYTYTHARSWQFGEKNSSKEWLLSNLKMNETSKYMKMLYNL